MSTAIFWFAIDPPGGMSMTYGGGPIKPSKRPGYVWITKPGGEKLFEVHRNFVRPVTHEEAAARLLYRPPQPERN